MSRDFAPEPEPSGSLEPPRRDPPTAVGAATPNPEYDGPSESVVSARSRRLPSSALIMLKLLVAVPVLTFKLGRRVVRRLVAR